LIELETTSDIRNAVSNAKVWQYFSPKSVAVIGASENPNKVGGRPIYYMKKFGYSGEIYPVNPKYSEIQGIKAFPSIDSLPQTPDAAIIAVSGKAAIEAISQCAIKGVKTAVVMSSGFAETGEEGRKLQDNVVELARKHGMRLIGPNSQGIANFKSGAVLNFSTMFMGVDPLDGPIAIISQSGAASVMPYALLREQGYGIRYLASTGNDADLGVPELILEVAQDSFIKLILVYVESISDADTYFRAAKIASQRNVKIILLKGGVSQKGASAAASHTGALIEKSGVLEPFMNSLAIRVASDLQEMVSAVGIYLQDGEPGQGFTVVMSHSGAVGVMAADLAEKEGLRLAELSQETRAAISKYLPTFGTVANPLDLTAALMGNAEMFPAILSFLADDPNIDMCLIGVPVAGPGYDIEGMAKAVKSFFSESRKTVVVSAPQVEVRSAFMKAGIPTFAYEKDAISALAKYSKHKSLGFKDVLRGPGIADLPKYSGTLSEAESLALLEQYGIPVVAHVASTSADEASKFAAKIGFPVVIKGCAAEVPHKSDYGLVHLGVNSIESAYEAARSCLRKLQELGVANPQVIVGKQLKGEFEFLLGASVDPIYGPLVMIGEGGVLAEIRNDVVMLAAPLTLEEAIRAIGTLRIARVLAGVRGGPELDIDALAKTAVELGNFASNFQESLISVDLNPVMIMPKGMGVIAVDAVVEFKN
jgi:acyl-CoA synthetase (NDP forming)